MRTPQRILDAVDRALDLVDAGQLEEAEAIVRRAMKKAPDAPEIQYALGEIASARGQVDEAIARFLDAADRDPEWPMPLLAAGREELESEDAERALEIADEVLETWPDDPEARAQALLLRAHAYLDLDDVRAATEALAAIEIDGTDRDLALDVAAAFCDAGEHGREESVLRTIVERDPNDADALHALGECLMRRGEREEATKLWLRVRELDLEAEPSGVELSPEELEGIAERTLRELPEQVRKHLANVPILVEDVPSEDLVRDGWDPRMLGFFNGTPLPQKSSLEGSPRAPDSAILFLRNLEACCANREELEEQVRITILHETAHFFGLDDDELDALGLG